MQCGLSFIGHDLPLIIVNGKEVQEETKPGPMGSLQRVSDQKGNKVFGTVCYSLPKKLKEPLFMFNDMPLPNKGYFYIDIEGIDTWTVLRGQQSMDKYGKKGENGAVIFRTKKPVTWITSKQIIKQMRAQHCCKPITLTVQTNQGSMQDDKKIFTKRKVAYFDKEFIEEIKIVDIDGNCRVVVKLKK